MIYCPFDRANVVKETLLGAINTQLLQPGDEVVSLYHRRIEHGYPTPSLGRDEVLAKALPWLQQYNIWSRGRFGSYKVRRHPHAQLMFAFNPLSAFKKFHSLVILNTG